MDEIRYGIVLGGGFSRGACQLGFLKSLTDTISIDNIKCLSASSIGTINSLAVSCECIDTLIRIWQDSDYGNVFSFRKAISRGLIEDIIDKLYKPRDITQYFTMCRLPQLSAHYYNVTDMNKRQLYNAADVSLAYPFVNGLVKRYNKMVYIDGGLVDNIPLYPLIGEDIDIIIILHCDPRYRPPQKLVSKTNAVIMDIDVTLRAEMWQKKYSLQHKDISAMIEAGISYGQHFCDEVINGYNTIEQIKNQSRKFMQEEWPVRKSKSNWLTVISKFNILHFARNFE